MKTIAIVLAVLGLIRAHAARDAAQTVPEVEALRVPYQKNLAAIESARQTRTTPITRSYAGDLDRLQREITSGGDLDGGLQIKAERERLESSREPTSVERKAMPPALAPLRARYEKEMQPILATLRNAEEQQKRDYVTALDSLQRRLTIQNQLDMKMIPSEARLDHDSSNTYRSLWFGSRPRKEKPKELGGDGRPVVGVYGFRGADCDVIGLIQMSK